MFVVHLRQFPVSVNHKGALSLHKESLAASSAECGSTCALANLTVRAERVARSPFDVRVALRNPRFSAEFRGAMEKPSTLALGFSVNP